jgi:hypothetical protein
VTAGARFPASRLQDLCRDLAETLSRLTRDDDPVYQLSPALAGALEPWIAGLLREVMGCKVESEHRSC